jgi:alpha-L-arabinofuranosidase
MSTPISRRAFTGAAAAAGMTALLPRGIVRAATAPKKAVVLAEETIGRVRPEFHGHFAEHLGSCTYGGIWVGKNSPIPNVNGFRKAVVDYLKELGIPVLRWPGGCFADDYHWRDGIGPAAKRPKRVNIHWGNYTEDNSFGTHEFMEFCRLIGAEPYFAANVGTGTPQEMRDWIEYCNYPKGSTLSDERAANGSPEPFRIKYWGIGNELWGCGGNLTPQQTALEFRKFATFARNYEADKYRLYLIGCGPNGNDQNWTRGFMDTLANQVGQMHGYSFHFYQNSQLPAHQFTPEAMNAQLNIYPRVEQAIVQQRTLLDAYDPARRIGLFLDEWGVWDRILPEDDRRRGRLWQQSTMRSAIAAGLGLNIFNRQADKLYMCNIAQIVNVLQSLLLTDGPEGKTTVRTTSYHAFAMFKAHRGKMSVRTEADGNRFPAGGFGGRGGGGRGPQPQQDPHDLSISASREGGELVVTLVNPRHDTDMDIDCTLRGVTAKSGRAQILHDNDMNAFNSFEQPDKITVKPFEVGVEGGRLKLTLPAMSIATVTLQV